MRNMKKGFKTLGAALLLCVAFVLASCAGGAESVFVKPSVKVLPGQYGDVYTFAGKNIIAKDKQGKVRLFSENGKALSDLYDDMVFYGAYQDNSADNDCIIGKIGGAGFILDAKTGKRKAGPFKDISAITGNSLYFSYEKEGGYGLVYRKDFSVVTYQDRPFIYDSNAGGTYYDAALVNSEAYSEKDADGNRASKKFFVLGGKVVGEIGTSNPVRISPSSNYRDELYYVVLKDKTAGDLYGCGENLTKGAYTVSGSAIAARYITFQNDKDYQSDVRNGSFRNSYYFASAEKIGAAAESKYCILSYETGGTGIKEVYSGATGLINFTGVPRVLQYALIGTKLVNLVTGGTVCETVSSPLENAGVALTKNNWDAAGAVRACQYFNTADNKYHIIGEDGVEKAVSPSPWYAYADGKYIVSQTADTTVKFGGKTYDSASLEGRSVIVAANAEGIDLYNAEGVLIKAKVDSCAAYINWEDNFQYYVIEYKNTAGEDRAVFYADGKLSEEFYGYYSLGLNWYGGEAAHIAGAQTSVETKKVRAGGVETEVKYGKYKVFDFNTFKFVTEEFHALEPWIIWATPNSQAKAVVVGVTYNFDSDNRQETFENYTLNFINTGKKSAVIAGGKDITFGNGVFTGVTYGITVYDGAKGTVNTEVYGDNGKKIKTIKNFALGAQNDIYFASEKQPYIVFKDGLDRYGVYDKNFKIVIKPIYDWLDISPLGTVFAEKAAAFGILKLNGSAVVPVKNRGDGNGLIGICETDSSQYFKIYSGAGKKLFGKAYSIGDFGDRDYIFKLKEDRAPKPYEDYMKVGLTPEEEYVSYTKIYDGKYWRVIKEVRAAL